MRVMVVDDEAPARRRLCRMLEALPDVVVVGQAEDVSELDAQLTGCPVDVVFLDIRMPGRDGVSWARERAGHPAVVFVTAFDDFAVQAFELEAIDYVVKPVRSERLAATVARLRGRLPAAPTVSEEPEQTRVVTNRPGAMEVYDATAITRFWASQKYTLFLSDGDEQLIDEPLSSLEARLCHLGFKRVHRAELVRMDCVRALRSTGDGHELLLSDGQRARVSRRCLAGVRAALAAQGLTKVAPPPST